ncbi:host attachment protein [Pseudogulbenkiania subflava]|uniref:Protein required for attachment to host cells n=1 Tax=Pseudogulbenkiania subflava DSM 22618 TaxID=1123014 RepID=A0A1Y6BA08_9NEIS|nr:host attachment protein [Pseudogulbenkiania subflava]SMF00870.1 Protein required for attachment to host cells [Pseudogulbenkiania subflava DSM 22618]
MDVSWIVVADSRRARIFQPEAGGHKLTETAEISAEEGEAAAGGNHAEPPRGGHRTMVTRSDPQEHGAAAFARKLANALMQGRADGSFERLVLVAPPHFLGQLGECLPKEVERMVALKVSQELTHLDAAAIREHLPARW